MAPVSGSSGLQWPAVGCSEFQLNSSGLPSGSSRDTGGLRTDCIGLHPNCSWPPACFTGSISSRAPEAASELQLASSRLHWAPVGLHRDSSELQLASSVLHWAPVDLRTEKPKPRIWRNSTQKPRRGVDQSLYSSYAKLQGIYSVFLKIPENMVVSANIVPFWVGFWEYSAIHSKDS